MMARMAAHGSNIGAVSWPCGALDEIDALTREIITRNISAEGEKFGKRQGEFNKAAKMAQEAAQIIDEADFQNVRRLVIMDLDATEVGEACKAFSVLGNKYHYTVDKKRINEMHALAIGTIATQIHPKVKEGRYQVLDEAAATYLTGNRSEQVACNAGGLWRMVQDYRSGGSGNAELADMLEHVLDTAETHGGSYVEFDRSKVNESVQCRVLLYGILQESIIVGASGEMTQSAIARLDAAWNEFTSAMDKNAVL